MAHDFMAIKFGSFLIISFFDIQSNIKRLDESGIEFGAKSQGDESERACMDKRCAQVGPMDMVCLYCCASENILPLIHMYVNTVVLMFGWPAWYLVWTAL